MRCRTAAVLLLAPFFLHAAEQPESPPSDAPPSRAIMTVEQVVQLLDETVDWYRTLGTQQQASTQPSDLLILYANRQTADKVMALAFEIARANAELISSEASATAQATDDPASQQIRQIQLELDAQRSRVAGRAQTGERARPPPLQRSAQVRTQRPEPFALPRRSRSDRAALPWERQPSHCGPMGGGG